MEKDMQTEFEIRTASEDKTTRELLKFGEPTPFTCPECHGVLFELRDGARTRFRCHTGHAFSSDSLLSTVTESIEESLWNTVRCIEESVMLLKQLGDHYNQIEQTDLAALYYKKAYEAGERGGIVRAALRDHERLSDDRVRELAGAESAGEKESSP